MISGNNNTQPVQPQMLTQPTMTTGIQRAAQTDSTSVNASTAPSENFGLEPGGEIDEESFQHALVKYVLEDQNPEAATAYKEAFLEARAQGVPVEDAVKVGLKAVVEQGLLPEGEAEKINGITFRAAQLDDNLDALYDGRGGPGDTTIAKASIEEAVAKASEVFRAAESGELTLAARSLDAPSNAAPSASVKSAGGVAGGSGEFLWKPASESDGKLVVLLPSQYSGKIVSASIHSEIPPTANNRLEEGRFSGNANGGRAHFRFSKNGGSYPDGVYVVAKLSDGKSVSFPVRETSSRVTA